MNTRNIAIILSSLVCLASCGLDEAAYIPLVGLGSLTKNYVVPADDSQVEIEVYSNGPFHIERLSGDSSWLTVSSEKGNGDSKITVNCAYNESFKRRAGLVFCSDVDDLRDTVYVKQEGLVEAVISMENTSVIAPGKGGEQKAEVRTNVPFELMSVTRIFPEESDTTWIKGISIDPKGSGNLCDMTFTVDSNPDSRVPRTAEVKFTFTDGWGDAVGVTVNLVQRNANEGLGVLISFNEFKDNYLTGRPIEDYVILEGIVVSDRNSGNAGENEQSTTSSIDYSGSKRTIYLESLDGSAGIAIQTKTEDDNSVNRFDKVQILLHGTTAVLKNDPDRITLSDVTKAMFVSQIAGSKSDVPVKRKHINELTDSDIYTYVTLLDVEFPIRKAALVPCNEGYSIGTGASRISKYPLLTRDINGDVTYLMTNTVCIYRNDGTRLPYGSGNISGVIVHERFPRFEWRNGADPLDMEDDPTLAFISRYQIRHQSKDDIWGEMKDSVEDSFSALLTEYRYWNPDMDMHRQRPSYGENGWLDHTFQPKYTGSELLNYLHGEFQTHMWSGTTYDYLGPMGNTETYLFGANYGNLNGIGVILDPAKDHYNPLMSDLVSTGPDGVKEWCGQYAENRYAGYGPAGWSVEAALAEAHADCINYAGTSSMRGKSVVDAYCYTCFGHHKWWDDQNGRPYAWLINFSTKGISTNHLSMQISVLNTQQTWYAPRFWKAEWSYQDAQDEEHDGDWNLIGEYTVPDVSVWSNTLYSSIVAFKYINFDLPLEILGKESVYIRLRPANNLCSDGADYANAVLEEGPGTQNSCMNYFAIRYNK